MTITAKMILDSISPAGKRISTLQLRYPRMIHPEFLTHRVFSRNSSSSRAVPVKRLIEDILVDPAIPTYWGKNQPGMQARQQHSALVVLDDIVGWNPHQDEPIVGKIDFTSEAAWLHARDMAIGVAKAFDAAGYHKQIVNRLLEPFSHINTLVTSTEWENFFLLRVHPDAQPEFQELARQMFDQLMHQSDPQERRVHLPYIQPEDFQRGMESELKLISAARCARVSYMTHENKRPNYEDDFRLAHDLLAPPPHLSPFEHQALPSHNPDGHFANFKGWYSQRYVMENGSPKDI